MSPENTTTPAAEAPANVKEGTSQANPVPTLKTIPAPEAAVTAATTSSLRSGSSDAYESSEKEKEKEKEKERKDGTKDIGDAEKGQASHGSDLPEAEAQDASKAKEQPADPNIVDWDGPDDPQDPRNWSSRKKALNILVLATVTFLTPLASSMFAPGVPEVEADFNNHNVQLASFVVSIYVLGYALGPLVIAPLSELYGRQPLYHVCNCGFVLFTIACALATNMNMLIAFRFIEGLFGSCPITIGGGTIADLYAQQHRGRVMAIWALGPLLGPVIGPVCGGYLSEGVNWRWVFWVIAIAAGVITLFGFFCLRESFAPVLLERKTERLRKETGNINLKSKLASPYEAKDVFRMALIRPMKLLLFSPIVLALSIHMSVTYGYLYLLFSTITEVFESTYHFSAGSVGLTYLGIGIGCLVGVGVFGFASDRILRYLSQRHGGEMKPEYRLPPMIPGTFFIPAGLFIYGWVAEERKAWIGAIIGTSLVGFGMLATFMPITTYLVDSFTIYAASAIAANTVLRSLAGALLPLAARKMYATLGLGWGNSLLGFIAVALCPVPILLYKYGERIRTSERFALKL